MDAPTISVTTDGSAFVVTGSGFTPGSTVHIRVVDDQLNQLFFDQSAEQDGSLNARLTFPCNAGLALHFSANDGRPNSEDMTGTLWSNTFDIPCPGNGGNSGNGSDGNGSNSSDGDSSNSSGEN